MNIWVKEMSTVCKAIRLHENQIKEQKMLEIAEKI